MTVTKCRRFIVLDWQYFVFCFK